jgi:hypothetical protein
MVDLGGARLRGEQALDRSLGHRPGEVRDRRGELRAGRRRARERPDGGVGVDDPHRHRPAEDDDRRREVLDDGGQRALRHGRDRGQRACPRDGHRDRHAPGHRMADGDDTLHVLDRVAPRAVAGAPRGREAVPALPRAQPFT